MSQNTRKRTFEPAHTGRFETKIFSYIYIPTYIALGNDRLKLRNSKYNFSFSFDTTKGLYFKFINSGPVNATFDCVSLNNFLQIFLCVLVSAEWRQ